MTSSNLDQIRDKWTAKDQGIGLEADPDKTSVNRFAWPHPFATLPNNRLRFLPTRALRT